jgi:hypothetical protein
MSEYETVAASSHDQVLGPTGATGDYLAGVLIVPATTSPGAVSDQGWRRLGHHDLHRRRDERLQPRAVLCAARDQEHGRGLEV